MKGASRQAEIFTKEIAPLDPYILDEGNRPFLKGKSMFIGELLWAVILFIIIWVFLLLITPSLFQYLNGGDVILGWAVIGGVFGVCVLLLVKYYKSAMSLARQGSLLVGKIEEFNYTGRGADYSDHFFYEVIYSFTTPDDRNLKGQTEVSYSKSATKPLKRPVVILYLDDKKFKAL
jgi:hypothetical protein